MNKTVLVTGASSGIGFEIASYLFSKGYRVYGASRTLPKEAEFNAISLDVTDQKSVEAGIERIIAAEGKIDVLVNNAGIGSAGAVERTPIKDVNRSFEVNLYGVVRLCQSVLPYMREQKYGRIINMSTLGSMIGLPYRGFYSASKGAMDLMTEAMRLEVERFGIQACTIHPGEVRTNIGAHRVLSILEQDEVYGKTIDNAFKNLDASVAHGKDPKLFGPLVEKIITAKKVKRNYYVGTFNELLGVKLKKFLPYNIYESILRAYFKAND